MCGTYGELSKVPTLKTLALVETGPAQLVSFMLGIFSPTAVGIDTDLSSILFTVQDWWGTAPSKADAQTAMRLSRVGGYITHSWC